LTLKEWNLFQIEVFLNLNLDIKDHLLIYRVGSLLSVLKERALDNGVRSDALAIIAEQVIAA